GDSVVFFQGILEGIARIEAQAYAVLAELGAPAVSTVWTTGEGSLNPAWTRIRARALGVPLKAARSQQPVYGVAQLAAGALQQFARCGTTSAERRAQCTRRCTRRAGAGGGRSCAAPSAPPHRTSGRVSPRPAGR